jgi:hypothetical protein
MNWIISSIIVLKKSVLLGTPTHCTVKPVGYSVVFVRRYMCMFINRI